VGRACQHNKCKHSACNPMLHDTTDTNSQSHSPNTPFLNTARAQLVFGFQHTLDMHQHQHVNWQPHQCTTQYNLPRLGPCPKRPVRPSLTALADLIPQAWLPLSTLHRTRLSVTQPRHPSCFQQLTQNAAWHAQLDSRQQPKSHSGSQRDVQPLLKPG
jgi:hypothetical protein